MIEVLFPGTYTTIQDSGRFGFRNTGVPQSGVMDEQAAGIANALLNNPTNAAVMEITLTGPRLLFNAPTVIAITGALMSPQLNGYPLNNNKAIRITAGDIVSFGQLLEGARAYVSVVGGFHSPVVMGSRSMYKGITSSIHLNKYDVVHYESYDLEGPMSFGSVKSLRSFNKRTLKVIPGPEFSLFTQQEIDTYLNKIFTIGHNNRMGYRMEGDVSSNSYEIVTGPVIPGTVQIPPSGLPIVLMKDAQTTGGYPRLFQLTTKSLALLAQKKSGDKIQFTSTQM